MRPWGFGRLPPVGGAIGWREGRAVWRATDPGTPLRAGLRERVGAAEVSLHASGREALRVACAYFASRSGRTEILVPAYTCWSIPAAAVAAGLRVRLVDVTLEGQIDLEALEKLPLERAAVVVVSNLLGVPEPIAPLRSLLDPAGVAVVDDAAQALGADAIDGPVGGRGDVGLLSFARGKPLSALGGGGLAWKERPDGLHFLPDPAPRRAEALARAAAYDLALLPWSFRALASIPALRIGETDYDPEFARGGIDGASLCLAGTRLAHLDTSRRQRSAVAEHLANQLRDHTRFTPLTAQPGRGAYPRLGVVAPSHTARNKALTTLAPLGVTPLYPAPLDAIPALAAQCVGDRDAPVARNFADRLLTLPVHALLREREQDAILRALCEAA